MQGRTRWASCLQPAPAGSLRNRSLQLPPIFRPRSRRSASLSIPALTRSPRRSGSANSPVYSCMQRLATKPRQSCALSSAPASASCALSTSDQTLGNSPPPSPAIRISMASSSIHAPQPQSAAQASRLTGMPHPKSSSGARKRGSASLSLAGSIPKTSLRQLLHWRRGESTLSPASNQLPATKIGLKSWLSSPTPAQPLNLKALRDNKLQLSTLASDRRGDAQWTPSYLPSRNLTIP